MRRAGLAVLVVAAALAAGCGRSPAPQAAVPPGPLPVGPARLAAHALAQRGDWAGAIVKYREALRAEPDDVLLRFALGSALSHADRHQEAVEQLRWVVAHGRRSLPEVAAARQWLQDVGALELEPLATTAAAKPVDPRSTGTVSGATTWPDAGPDSHRLTLQILLVGDEPATKGRRLQARTRLGEPYAVSGVPEGRYRLMAQVSAIRLWDTPVEVTAGKDTVLNLTPETSPVSPQAFPQRQGG